MVISNLKKRGQFFVEELFVQGFLHPILFLERRSLSKNAKNMNEMQRVTAQKEFRRVTFWRTSEPFSKSFVFQIFFGRAVIL